MNLPHSVSYLIVTTLSAYHLKTLLPHAKMAAALISSMPSLGIRRVGSCLTNPTNVSNSVPLHLGLLLDLKPTSE